MDSTHDWRGLICALLYPVQFTVDPVTQVDRVLEIVVHRQVLDAIPAAYLRAVTSALASTEALAELLPQPHAEAIIRGYLAEMACRLGGLR